MDFIESEAEESEEEIINRKRKVNDDDDEEEEEEEEEDDDAKIQDEMKDLINDEEENEDSEEEVIKRRRKRQHEDYDDALEDEDYDLLEENLGVKVKRTKKFRRLKRIEDEESDDEETHDSGQPVDDREAIANELFEGDEAEADEAMPHQAEQDDQFGDESDGESDESDFIVDDDGQPITKGKKKRHIKYTDSALQEAQEIFGVDFDYAEFKDDGDEYEEDIEEEYEEDDEVEGTERPKQKKSSRGKQSQKSIYDVFEPSELERGHFTKEDDVIRTTDMPERFQLRCIAVTLAEPEEISEEAEWIYKQAFSNPSITVQEVEQTGQQPIGGRKGHTAVGKIREALEFMRNQNLEVPFIAFYRKEYVEPDLNINDLWTVYKWDEKWCQLKERKTNLGRLFSKMQQYQCDVAMEDPDKPLADGMRPIDEKDFDRLKKADTIEELNDCYTHFRLYYGHDIPAMKELLRKKARKESSNKDKDADGNQDDDDTTMKQIVHTNPYRICLDAGLDGLAKKFGLTPEQFGENLRDNYQRNEVDQYPVEPLEVASDFVCKRFPTADEALRAAKYMVATQLSKDPVVRRCVRQVYFERAKFHVKPTKKGLKEVDETHSCYGLKYVKNKPITDLKADQFLKLTLAEKSGLLKVTITMDKRGDTHSYLEEIKQLYERDEFSKHVQNWNAQRYQALEITLNAILYPHFEKELRMRLLAEAKDGIIKACCRKLYNWLKVAPYQVDPQMEEEEDFDTRDGIRVLAISYVPDRGVPFFGALVNGDGEIKKYIRLPNMLCRRNGWNEKEKILKEKDLGDLKHFIFKKRPHVVAVAAESREALTIVEDIKFIINELVDAEQFPPISVELIDNELGVLYSNSKKSESDFRDYPPLLRQAISIARRLQDPLVEFSQLCTPDEELLCIKYHPFQDEINRDDLLNALYLEFVNRTNEVGVDINRCISHSHTANLLQFICGFGPRKGGFMLKSLKRSQQQLETRSQLIVNYHMGPSVFRNCAGFIKIDTTSFMDSTETYLDVLDGTRVHPEAADWARKMAVDALEYDDNNPGAALEEILDNPDKLKDLDLDAFAEELERQGLGSKSITLYDIRAELNHKYKDLRSTYRSPNPEEIFNMLTKETPETFYIGKLIFSTVTGIARRKPKSDQLENANPIRNDETGLWQCPFCMKKNFPELSDVWSHFDDASCPGQAMGVRTRLDNGISGFIPTKMISDKPVTNPDERVQANMMIHARITKIDIDRFAVDLTCRSSDLTDKNNEWRPAKDIYYDYEAEEADTKVAVEAAKKLQRQVYLKRVIVHPSFKNVGFKEAEKLLESMDQGDVIIRPSSKGNDHLTVTWKVHEEINQHIDVREEGKENAFSLGRSLVIGSEDFEDLDEIIARHIQPMAAHARDLINFRYFISANGGKREDIDKFLGDEKKKAPNKIHYTVSASQAHPGKFLLSYLPRIKVRHEWVSIQPEGFRYRTRIFRSVNSLFRWFKDHFRDPIPGTPASVSIRTPAGQSSFIENTPSINLANLDAAAIQRAAASMPRHLFNTLSQVAGQTPRYQSGSSGAAAGGNSYNAGYNSLSYQQPYTPSQPIGTTPLVTPSYHVPTPAQSQATTPRYHPRTPQSNWTHPASRTPTRTPTQSSSSTTTTAPPATARAPTSTVLPIPIINSNAAGNPSAADWKRMAEQWAKKKQQLDNKIPVQMTPRTPRNRGSPSPMVESTPAADATPLIDEF